MRSLGKFLGTAIICALFFNSIMAMEKPAKAAKRPDAADILIKKARSFNYASSPLQSVGIKTLEDLDRMLNMTRKGTPKHSEIQSAIVDLRIKLIKCGQYRVNPPQDYTMGAADRVSGAARAFESFEYFNSPEGASALKGSDREDEYKELADRRHVILYGARGYLREAKETKTGWAQSAVAKIEQEQLKQTLKPQIARIEKNLRDVQESESYQKAVKIIKELKEKTREYNLYVKAKADDLRSLKSFIRDVKDFIRGREIYTKVSDILKQRGIANNEDTKSMISTCENFVQLTAQKNTLLSQISELNAIRKFLKDKPTITLDNLESKLQALTQEFEDISARWQRHMSGVDPSSVMDISKVKARQAEITKEKKQLEPVIAFFKKS
ncbi:MAG: hypothetical protein WCS92_02575 [Candidatus Babeliales bacterium]|jgi:DNA-binding Lrp family transcriptional regulator